MELSHEQQAILRFLERNHAPVFVTGKAGTGKSVLLQAFRNSTKKRVVVCAPTGIAALNVHGQTIHSLFRLPLGIIQKDSLHSNDRLNMLLRGVDSVVIDEISMVRADVLDAIDHRLRQAHRRSVPFEGVQVVLFGDLYQLPPIVGDTALHAFFEEQYGGHFFFHAAVWKEAPLTTYELTHIFRQKDENFKLLLNALREGQVTPEQLAILNQRLGASVPKETITLATTNARVTEINEKQLAKLRGKLFEYQATIEGAIRTSSFPTEEVLQLKKGAQVVLLKNDRQGRWVNGTLASIASLTLKQIEVIVQGRKHFLEREVWEEIRYTYENGKLQEEVVSSFTQYPIRLAWAMTIHKAQGQTHDSIVIDLTHETFSPGQLYVALTRCTSFEGMILTKPIEQKHISVDPQVVAFMQNTVPISLLDAH